MFHHAASEARPIPSKSLRDQVSIISNGVGNLVIVKSLCQSKATYLPNRPPHLQSDNFSIWEQSRLDISSIFDVRRTRTGSIPYQGVGFQGFLGFVDDANVPVLAYRNITEENYKTLEAIHKRCQGGLVGTAPYSLRLSTSSFTCLDALKSST